jgi:hypothetical protein
MLTIDHASYIVNPFKTTIKISPGSLGRLFKTDPERFHHIIYWIGQRRTRRAQARILLARNRLIERLGRLPYIREICREAKAHYNTVKKALEFIGAYIPRHPEHLLASDSSGRSESLSDQNTSTSTDLGASTNLDLPAAPPVKRKAPEPLDPEKLRELVEKSKKPPQESYWQRLQRLMGVNKAPPS